MAAGRQPGWSLHLNPTPFLIEQSGLATADQYRFAQGLAEQARASEFRETQRNRGDDGRTL